MADRDRNARVIIVQGVFVAAFVISIPVIVFSLMARAGWSTLASRYRAAEAFGGAWTVQPTAVMSHVPLDDPGFRSQQMRFIGGTLRVTGPDALHLATPLSHLPLLGRLFPELRVPWSQVGSARTYEAPGWYPPQREPGALLQVAYDPNYTGAFVELALGDPAVYLMLPTSVIDRAVLERLPAAR